MSPYRPSPELIKEVTKAYSELERLCNVLPKNSYNLTIDQKHDIFDIYKRFRVIFDKEPRITPILNKLNVPGLLGFLTYEKTTCQRIQDLVMDIQEEDAA